ncbi:amino acid deaminase/aldolase [Conexibacter stalactiti]|uniref:Amino acid deaminase/aldolase n=1 Tax=Conexibacter stalactiti TaxID=1940611 RepID=A0ABU4HTG9_9ACTN|nr:amino acid deaminase/aldolase [Conexibacter stalactiti]MDW5596484.1 amino acid deaminase/aldolase [Conexibacter stalactiti]MEC5037126.1 amino acid deaminase/aldolase [Conexibacter stalactiti]
MAASPEQQLARLDRATAALDPPFAAVDLDAYGANARDLLRRAGGRPIRLASKSIRCRALLERTLASDPGFQGTLAFTLPEALWLADHGLRDLVVAYPTVDRAALRALASRADDGGIALMVDDLAQLELIERAVGGAGPIRLCIDADAGWRPLRGRIRIGAKRSPLHTPAQAAALARAIVARPAFRLVGIMAYESQIAGVGDRPPGNPLRGVAVRAMQRASVRELAQRRAAIVAAVEAVAPLEFVNGGGTGSIETTAAEPAVTEIAAGSGLYGPTLFDAYTRFSPLPAALFALPVVRRPGRHVATALGGGYLASGPADRARLPRPLLPAGLKLDSQEGAGEVQTPLLGAAAGSLRVGDRVWFRHAKAGEMCERFAELHLIEGEHVVETVPTYRGEGQSFL